jgi:hypothetical protein
VACVRIAIKSFMYQRHQSFPVCLNPQPNIRTLSNAFCWCRASADSGSCQNTCGAGCVDFASAAPEDTVLVCSRGVWYREETVPLFSRSRDRNQLSCRLCVSKVQRSLRSLCSFIHHAFHSSFEMSRLCVGLVRKLLGEGGRPFLCKSDGSPR